MAIIPIYITDQRGGRNGIDSPVSPSFPMNQCTEALNVDFFDTPLGRKRGGAATIGITGGTAFSVGSWFLKRHVPAGDESAMELWGVDGTGLTKRLAGGTAWANVTLKDAWTGGAYYNINGVAFNGKLFLFGQTAVDRAHVWDGSTVRRVGLAAFAAGPTVANQGSGSYPNTARYYRARSIEVVGGVVIRRSEASASSAVFTPSASGLSARVTRPTAVGEGESHWEIEVSSDGVTFYILAGFAYGTQIAIATTTYDDTTLSTAYSSLTLAFESGAYSLMASYRFGITDGNRLIMAGQNSNGKTSRIFYTPVLGSTNEGDDERVPTLDSPVNYLDINEKDGGAVTGLGGPINGVDWAFKYRQTWRLTPTGDIDTPLIARKISNTIGCIGEKSIINGEDAAGNPCLYFWSAKGPYRLGMNGLEYLGRDVEDYLRGLNGKTAVNSLSSVPPHGVYHADINQVWWWVSTGNNNSPDLKLILDVKQATMSDQFGVRGGWSVHTGLSAVAVCSSMFSNTIGASMTADLKPYVGRIGPVISKCDTSDQTDEGTPFQSYITTRSLLPIERLGERVGVRETMLVAKAQSGVSIQQSIIKDFGVAANQTDSVLLTAEGSESRVIRKFDGSMQADMGIIQIQLGDASAIAATWALDALMVPVDTEGEL